MAIKVNPNRMELLKLRRRTAIARRGHKLLKDKFDELMKQFLALIDRARTLRLAVEADLARAYELFVIARAETAPQVVDEALMMPKTEMQVSATPRTLLNVRTAQLKLEQAGSFDSYSLATTPSSLDEALRAFDELLPRLIELGEVENSVRLLASEIERTRRRVNALEYVLIPQLEGAVRFITMKLDEIERANLTRLMKIKEMVGQGVI